MVKIDAETLLKAYAFGVFPMAEGRDAQELYWIDPERRGILPLEDFHVPSRLARKVRAAPYEIRFDSAFRETMLACAEEGDERDNTWINDRILALYCELFAIGYAHSVECWQMGRMVGGLYGVALGGAFFGESMFSREVDASKIALVHLVDHLKAQGFVLLDTQFVTQHLEQFGARDIPREDYRDLLEEAVSLAVHF